MSQLTSHPGFIQCSVDSSLTYDSVIIDAVDSAFSVLGTQAKAYIYSFLENNRKIAREAIPSNVEAFTTALEDIFGGGSRLLEIGIMRALHRRVPAFVYREAGDEFSFATYVRSVQLFLADNQV